MLIEPEHVTAISGLRPRPENYALAFDRYLAVPRDRGYPFTLIDNHAACLNLDGTLIAISPRHGHRSAASAATQLDPHPAA